MWKSLRVSNIDNDYYNVNDGFGRKR